MWGLPYFHPAQMLGGSGCTQFHAQQVRRVQGFPDTVCGRKVGQRWGQVGWWQRGHPGELLGLCPASGAEDRRVLSKPLAEGSEHRTSASQELPFQRSSSDQEGAVRGVRGRTPERRLKSLGLYGPKQFLKGRAGLCNTHAPLPPAQQPPAATLFSAARPHCHGRLSCRGSAT